MCVILHKRANHPIWIRSRAFNLLIVLLSPSRRHLHHAVVNPHLVQQRLHVLPHLHLLSFHHQDVQRTHRFVSRIHEKLRRGDSPHALHRADRFLHALPERFFPFGNVVQQHARGVIDQREHRQQNQHRDDERADGIGDPQPVFLLSTPSLATPESKRWTESRRPIPACPPAHAKTHRAYYRSISHPFPHPLRARGHENGRDHARDRVRDRAQRGSHHGRTQGRSD